MQVRSEETRKRILDSAMRLFADKGYEATGVAEICTVAEASKGAFYHHFPSKQAIFLELFRDWLRQLDEGLGAALKKASSVPNGLLAMAGEMKGVFSAADGRIGLFLEFWQQARREPEIWKELNAPYLRYQEYFADIIRKGIAEGSFGDVDPVIAGQTLVALAVGIVVQGIVNPLGAEWDRVTHDAVKLLISGLGSERPAAVLGRR
jgi:AcrR family transcriptional regulator